MLSLCLVVLPVSSFTFPQLNCCSWDLEDSRNAPAALIAPRDLQPSPSLPTRLPGSGFFWVFFLCLNKHARRISAICKYVSAARSNAPPGRLRKAPRRGWTRFRGCWRCRRVEAGGSGGGFAAGTAERSPEKTTRFIEMSRGRGTDGARPSCRGVAGSCRLESDKGELLPAAVLTRFPD